LEPEEPEDEEPVVGDGGVATTGERLACTMRTPGEKNKKAYGYSYRWVCQCPNQEHWECSMPTGWGPPKAGRTKKGNKFVKDLWPSDCRCSCPDSCGGTVNMRRREWRGDSDELVSEVERQKEVKGRCVDDPVCGPEVGPALAGTLRDIERQYIDWSVDERQQGCEKISSLNTWVVMDSWDILDFRSFDAWAWDSRCGLGKECRRTVQVTTCRGRRWTAGCWSATGVNYVMFGRMWLLCAYHPSLMRSRIDAHRLWRLWDYTTYLEALLWATLGYHDWPSGVAPTGHWRNCALRCPVSYPNSGIMQWCWEPNVPC
jgi:hypothetical protein